MSPADGEPAPAPYSGGPSTPVSPAPQPERQRYALGVDFGTSNTVAVGRWPDGRVRPILVDGSPLLPSAVYAEPDGTLLVGRDAVHSARLDPARFEPNPKRRIDDETVRLGDRDFPAIDLVAAVLGRIMEEWHRVAGEVTPKVTLTCPATWDEYRRTLLALAAAQAGIKGARLVVEPVAAATYFAEVLGRDVPIGSVVVVHDFGGGTFDASVVTRTASGFEVMVVGGRDDLGGLDIDAAIVDHLKTDAWQPLLKPTTVSQRRAQRQLWDDVRVAKERLSRALAADFVVPLLDTEMHLTRDELERLADPVLAQTVRLTKGLLDWAKLPPGRLAGVFLVGGASRIPLLAKLLQQELGLAPVVIEQPELVVAEGSILAGAAQLASAPAELPTEAPEVQTASVTETGPAPTAQTAALTEAESVPVVQPPTAAVVEAETVRVAEAAPATPTETAAVVETQTVHAADAETTQVAEAETVPVAEAQTVRVAEAATPVAETRRTPVAAAETVRVPKPAATPDAPTVRVPGDRHVPGTTGLAPPVDPWPEADPGAWVLDPHGTVVTPRQPTPVARVPVTGSPAGGRPTSPALPPTRPLSPNQPWAPTPRQGRPETPTRPVGGRPVPPSSTARLPSASTSRPPASSPTRVMPGAAGPVRPAANTRPAPRRRGRFLRSIQMMFSVAVIIAVPLAALLVAYGYGNGEPWRVDAINLVHDITRLLGGGTGR